MPDIITNSLIVMFADDAKCFKVIDSLTDCTVFQNDLDSLSVWSIRNELPYILVYKSNFLDVKMGSKNRSRLIFGRT